MSIEKHLARRVGREGRCYELAFRFLSDNPEGARLIHALVYSPALHRNIGHALVDVRSELIYEPVLAGFFIKNQLYESYHVEELASYSRVEAATLLLSSRNYGPWGESALRIEEAERIPVQRAFSVVSLAFVSKDKAMGLLARACG